MSHLFASARRNAEFHSLFKNIPSDELLIDSYSCALSREILIHGRLYLSASYVCFNANILGWVTNVVLSMSDVISIEKRMTALIIPNGISFSTISAKYDLASFIKRDVAFNKIALIWRNSLSERPVSLTELLAGFGTSNGGEVLHDSLSLRRLRDRKASELSDFGFESVMEEPLDMDRQDFDPALIVRREYSFGSSRARVSPRLSVSEIDAALPEGGAVPSEVAGAFCSANSEALDQVDSDASDEEQREVRESILPCGCAFHYRSTIVDQIVFASMDQFAESLVFPDRDSPTSVPRAFQRTLKHLGGRDIKFHPWKVYLGKWERRVWSCRLPASKILLTDSFLSLKVTDSIVSRSSDRLCIESLAQIDGVPGGGCFVKWKMCITRTSQSREQTRIMITAAAAAPLGSWFKESIRDALLQHAEELWACSICCAAAADSDGASRSQSQSGVNLPLAAAREGMGLGRLSYFDRKAFFRCMLWIFALFAGALLAVVVGIRMRRYRHAPDMLKRQDMVEAASQLHHEYFDFLINHLKLPGAYSKEMDAIAQDVDEIDSWVLQAIGSVSGLQQELIDGHAGEGREVQ